MEHVLPVKREAFLAGVQAAAAALTDRDIYWRSRLVCEAHRVDLHELIEVRNGGDVSGAIVDYVLHQKDFERTRRKGIEHGLPPVRFLEWEEVN